MKMDSIVIVNLQNPKERFFGRLVEITSPGVTIRGIDINAFEDWMDHITHREETGVQPTTVFSAPPHRKTIMDEGIGAIPSLSDTFLTKVGTTVQDHLSKHEYRGGRYWLCWTRRGKLLRGKRQRRRLCRQQFREDRDLKKGIILIYEPGLPEIVDRNLREERLTFSTDLTAAVKVACYLHCSRHTDFGRRFRRPHRRFRSRQAIGRAMDRYKVIVVKSTVPVGTNSKLREIIKKETNHQFDVLSNPEFLKQGAAADDFMKPDRVVVGADDVRAPKSSATFTLPSFEQAARFSS
jgi:hypothetical protein